MSNVAPIDHEEGGHFYLEEGDGIRLVRKKAHWFHLVCCDCGKTHEVKIRWKNDRTIDLHFHDVPNKKL